MLRRRRFQLLRCSTQPARPAISSRIAPSPPACRFSRATPLPLVSCPCRELFGQMSDFLKEGLEVTLNFHKDDPVTGEVPGQVRCGGRRGNGGRQGAAYGGRGSALAGAQ